MTTWEAMSQECFRASQKLLTEGYLRRSVSSAYYAAYSAATSLLVARKITFAHGWHNPTHEQLPDLIKYNLALPPTIRYRLPRILRRLRTARENADYRPHETVDRTLALACVRDCSAVLALLEIEDERRK